jgi:hypothetical protein
MMTANGHIAAEDRCILQLRLAALVRATILRAADVQAVYVADAAVASAASATAGKSIHPTYYSYRYL